MTAFLNELLPGEMAGVPNWLWTVTHPELARVFALGGLPGSVPPSGGGAPGTPAATPAGPPYRKVEALNPWVQEQTWCGPLK